jgi:hypothetical protein
MKARILLLVPIVLLAVAYGAAKAYVHYQVTTGLDELIAKAAPVAAIEYEDVGSDLTGALTIEKIEVTHEASGFYVNIDALEIQGDDFGFLLELTGGLERGEPPSKLSARFRGVEIPISHEFFDQIKQAAEANSLGSSEVCSLGGILQRSELMDLGYSTITADMGFGYEYDRDLKRIDARFDYKLAGVESLSMAMRVGAVSDQPMGMMASPPVLEKASMVYRVEPDYMRRAVEYCAAGKKQDRQAFLRALFPQGDDAYYQRNLGFVPGPGLREMFREMVTKGGDVRVRITPPPDFTVQKLNMYRPEDLVEMLIQEVSINDRLVTDLSFSQTEVSEWDVTGDAAVAEERQVLRPRPDTAAGAKKAAGADQKQRQKPQWAYREVDKRELGKYLGRQVRLYIKGSPKPRAGELDEVTDKKALVDQRHSGGTFTTHVPFDRMLRAEVFLPGPP